MPSNDKVIWKITPVLENRGSGSQDILTLYEYYSDLDTFYNVIVTVLLCMNPLLFPWDICVDYFIGQLFGLSFDKTI